MREEWKSDDGAMEDTVSPIKSDEQIDTLHTRLKRQLDALGSPATVPVYQPGPTGTLWQKLSTVTQKRTSTKSSQSDTTHTFVGSARKRRKVQWYEQTVEEASGSPPAQQATWVPPASPFGLIEEQVYHDPWKLLLACMLLNRTTATQVRRLWEQLMATIPDPQAAAAADPAVIEAIIQPLGFQRFRARGIIAMSSDYLRPWKRPSELRFIGKYASDAYWIFCRGMWRDTDPDDKDLKRYRDWLQENDGQGMGLTRDEML